MKVQTWDAAAGRKPAARRRPLPRKSVASILRAAYRRFAGDPVTRRAVRRFLP